MPGTNEGFRVLEEFCSQAIAVPTLSALTDGCPARGANEGVSRPQELLVSAGLPESTANLSNEGISRYTITAIFQARAVELRKRLPVAPADLDFGEQGSEALVNAVSRYIRIRDMNRLAPSRFRATFFSDLAVLMVDIARPWNVFRADARGTAIEVAERLLQLEGWSASPGSLSDWRAQAREVDPADTHAAKKYLALLKRFWGWTGSTMAVGTNQTPMGNSIVVPETILANLMSRCV